MALFQCKIFSRELFRNINVNVTLPIPDSDECFAQEEPVWPSSDRKYQVLWLLHGFIGDESDWQRFSNIERYAKEHCLAVVMPDGYNSMYTNDPFGAQYFNFYTQELPEMLRHIYPISEKPEDNFIAGLSMGGYGALKAAFRCPEKYGAAASLSGALNPNIMIAPAGIQKQWDLWVRSVFGRELEYWDPKKDDLKVLLKEQTDQGIKMPPIYQCCGTEDFLYEVNRDFREFAMECGTDLTYAESPGIHNFDFWDPYIRKIMDWLPLKHTLVESDKD